MKKWFKKYWWAVALVVLILLALLIWNVFLNPRDVLGRKCQTFYNQSSYTLNNGIEVPLPSNSCFVGECCSYTASFRTFMSREDVEEYQKNLEEEIHSKYPEMSFTISVEDHTFFRTINITYNNYSEN